jgi:hypothetical protein
LVFLIIPRNRLALVGVHCKPEDLPHRATGGPNAQITQPPIPNTKSFVNFSKYLENSKILVQYEEYPDYGEYYVNFLKLWR